MKHLEQCQKTKAIKTSSACAHGRDALGDAVQCEFNCRTDRSLYRELFVWAGPITRSPTSYVYGFSPSSCPTKLTWDLDSANNISQLLLFLYAHANLVARGGAGGLIDDKLLVIN